MSNSRSRAVRSAVVVSLITLALCLVLAACGGSGGEPVPSGAARVTGTLSLPAGHSIDVGSLEVVTPFGSYPVAPDGQFSAYVFKDTSNELGVFTPGGDLVALGVTEGAGALLSPDSSAEALLYYLVGGMWLPADRQEAVRGLLGARSEVADVTAHLQRLLLAGGNGLEAPDRALLDAMEAAQGTLLSDASVQAALVGRPTCPVAAWLVNQRTSALRPLATEVSVIIHGGTNIQAGAMLLHNPVGSGVVVQNHLRRPAALLAYEVAWEDLDGTVHEVAPPVLVGTIDVPATGNLELF